MYTRNAYLKSSYTLRKYACNWYFLKTVASVEEQSYYTLVAQLFIFNKNDLNI